MKKKHLLPCCWYFISIQKKKIACKKYSILQLNYYFTSNISINAVSNYIKKATKKLNKKNTKKPHFKPFMDHFVRINAHYIANLIK